MAGRPRRTSLATVDLTGNDDTSQGHGPARNSKAQTLRLPPHYWRYLRIKAALQDTSQVAILQQALDELMKREPLPPGIQ
jgi:hypothetical protein